MRLRVFVHFLAALLVFGGAFPAQARHEVLLTAWKFAPAPGQTGPEQTQFDDSRWQSVALPHTWNSKTQTQTRRAAWYRTHFTLTDADTKKELFKKELFVCFNGAGTIADVYVNGVLLGTHKGAFTRFLFDATRVVHVGDNLLAVRCDTDPKDTAGCLPAGDGSQLYHVPGGLYRPAHLLLTAPVHIDPTDCAASGVFLTPSAVSKDSATLEVKTLVRNDGKVSADATVTSTLEEAGGKLVATATARLLLAPQATGTAIRVVQVAPPRLWDTHDPYLYTVKTTVSVNKLAMDTVAERTGFRFFQMTPTTFFLNGVSTPLRGVAKHQETEDRGSAVTDADLRRDWDDLEALGVNYVRLAHYPHAKLEYDLADERGIVVWAENGHSNPAPPTETGRQITREMVLQNYNHPSICFWSIGNEAIKTLADIGTLEDYAGIVRREDPSRLTTYASNTAFRYSYALDFVAVNRYNGWYGGTIAGFDAHAAFYHTISETGAGGVISVHSAAAYPTHRVNRYEPEEYQQEVAESRCETVFRTLSGQIPLFTWWTFRDFSDPRYKGVNSKGMETFSGFKKDIFFLYQSFLKPQVPRVHLCGKPWFLRRALPPQTYLVKAYSSAQALTLTVNGRLVGIQTNGEYLLPNGTFADNVFAWDSALVPGRNTLIAQDNAGHSDTSVIYAETGEEHGLAQSLTSSNPNNPAFYIAAPVQSEWPFYDGFDGTGDNSFHAIPPLLDRASWITFSRPTQPLVQTALSFTLAPGSGLSDIFIMATSPAPVPDGWADTKVVGTWRDNTLSLVPYTLYRRTFAAGDTVLVPPMPTDYLVLLKPHTVASGAEP